MLVFAGFLFVGIKTKAGAGQVKAWNMATNQEYLMEGHVVSGAGEGGLVRAGKWQARLGGSERLGTAAFCRLPGALYGYLLLTSEVCLPVPFGRRPVQGAVQALAAAGDMLFSAGQDASLRVWKLDAASNQWQCVAVLKVEQGGHRAPISCLWASHPFLFSADYLGTLKVS